MKTVEEILSEKEVPAIAVDEKGLITFVNQAFETTYGWSATEMIGQAITEIIPHHMRDTHSVGFSRFISTETPTLLGKPLRLPVLCKDGREIQAEHTIVAEKQNNQWRIAATIQPVAG